MAGARGVPGWSRWRTLSFVLGVVATFLATQSVLGVYDMEHFSAHMIEHLALIMVAAPFSRSPRRSTSLTTLAAGRAAVTASSKGGSGSVVTHPVFGFLAYAVFIPLTHLTSLMNLMMTACGSTTRADRLPRRRLPLLPRRLRHRSRAATRCIPGSASST